MALNDIIRVTYQWLQPTLDVAQLVFHYQQVTAGDPDWADVLADIGTAFLVGWALIDDRVDSDVVGDIRQLALYDAGTNEFNTIAQLNSGSSFDGAYVAPQGGFQQSVCIKFPTALARSLGKKFLFGIGRDQYQDDTLIVGLAADALAAGLIWAQPVAATDATFQPGNWVRATGGFRPWTGTATVLLNESSQDRRRQGFGI